MPGRIPTRQVTSKRSAARPVARAVQAAPGNKKSEHVVKVMVKAETESAAVKIGPSQSSLFEAAIEQFNARNFREAMDLFHAVETGVSAELAHAARLHVRMCEQRLGQLEHIPKSGEDHYNLGVALINRRDLLQAQIHLEAALHLSPEGGHVHYAMALLNGLQGNYVAAARSLARAIELDPGNRAAALNDPDFHDILRRPEPRAAVESQGVPTA